MRSGVSTPDLLYWTARFASYIHVNQKLKHMTLNQLKEQIQEDIIAYLDGIGDEVLADVCMIVVDNFKKYEAGQD